MSQSALTPKTVALGALLALAIGAGALLIYNAVGGGDDLRAKTNRRTMIDARTGEVFVDLRVPAGSPIPLESPKTGESTLYPAELCFWTSEGDAKLEPTYVLLNEFRGEPGPTTCPDCGRRVVAHNPTPPADLMIRAAGGDAPP